jgi:hypothetical protein
MKTELSEIQETLIGILKKHQPTLKITASNETKFEVSGTIETMQGKKKVDGIYFASIVPKPKDIRLYFFPTYTHADALVPKMPEDLKKCLKGKSCFHIKKLDEDLEKNIEAMVNEGVKLYQKDGWLTK